MQLSDNSINIRHNRFLKNTSFEKYKIKKFNFENGLKSIDYPEEHFINKAKNESEEPFYAIFNMFILYKDGDYSFLNDFLGDELQQNCRTDRLLKIINKVQRKKYKNNDLPNIIKLKYKSIKGVYFYVKISRNNASLILIDLYHLGIFGMLNDNGKKRVVPIERQYRHHKNNMCDLDKIIQLCNIM